MNGSDEVIATICTLTSQCEDYRQKLSRAGARIVELERENRRLLEVLADIASTARDSLCE